MASISHEPATPMREKRSWSAKVLVTDMWASLAIVVMWLTVLIDALWGPDFVSASAGGNLTRIPSAIIFVIFAYLGTKAVAKYGFGRSRENPAA